MKGIYERKNKNGFYVFRIHYSADPDKDPDTKQGKVWYDKVRKGMMDKSWQKEYEIDWFAKSGELVYPMFDPSVHVVQPFAIPKSWTRYMALDPGLRNPTAALWAAVDPDDNIYFYREYYKAEMTPKEHAVVIKELEKGEKIFVRLIDPAARGRDMTTKKSVSESYAENKLFFIEANNKVELGISKVQEAMKIGKTGPRMYVFSTLRNYIQEKSEYRWHQETETVLRQKDPTEKPIKKRDHLMDCERYIIVANPHYRRIYGFKKNKDIHVWDGMSTGY